LKLCIREIFSEFVRGTTVFGDIDVIWEGEIPDIGKTYDVELDVDEVLKWEQDIYLTCSESYTITREGKYTVLCGTLESFDSDGYAVLRIGDYIIPFLTEGNPFNLNSRIKIRAKSIKASPISY